MPVIYNIRTISASDLEVTLVDFITRHFEPYRLDNPQVNLGQPLTVPYDETARIQTLELKVPPRVVRQRIPRTLTGEIDPNALPKEPAIIVQAVSVRCQREDSAEVGMATVRMSISAYYEGLESEPYQDVLNMCEALTDAWWSFRVIDHAYPFKLFSEWSMIERDTHPYYVAEMTTLWELPVCSPITHDMRRTVHDPLVGPPFGPLLGEPSPAPPPPSPALPKQSKYTRPTITP